MRAGTFNIDEYLQKLYEASGESDEKEKKEEHEAKESKEKEKKEEHEAKESDEKEEKEEKETKSPDKSSAAKSAPAPKQSTPATKQSSPDAPKGTTGTGNVDEEGIIMPAENKKFYSWLKGEYQKGKTEVKVEMKLGDAKFEPGYDMQTNLDSVKDFKPGMYGEVKTADNKTGGGKTFGANPNTNNQVTGLSKPAEQGNGQGKELQKSKAMTVKSEPTKPMAGGKPAQGKVGEKPSTPAAAEPEKSAEIEKIDIKTKKEKDA